MLPAGPRPFAPTVVVLTRTVLALAVMVGGLHLLGRELLSPPVAEEVSPPATQRVPLERRLYGLVRVVAVSAAALTAFIVGSYLMIRAGRAVLPRPGKQTVTEYTDAWSNYRLTREQIEAATRKPPQEDEPGSGGRDSGPPHPV
jgi:hypothetical protein